MLLKFPEGFYFGSATSATQCEGGAEDDGRGKKISGICGMRRKAINFMEPLARALPLPFTRIIKRIFS